MNRFFAWCARLWSCVRPDVKHRAYVPPDTLLERYRRSRTLPILALFAWLAPLITPFLARTALAQTDSSPPLASGAATSTGGQAGLGAPEGSPGTAAGTLAEATVEGATGVLHTKVSFDLPTARGAVQPTLALQYNSAGTFGVGGLGWSLGIPSIERHNPSGAPLFNDPDAGADIVSNVQDRFTFGGEPLVPICYFSPTNPECYDYQSYDPSGSANIASGAEKFPAFARSPVGWHYYRLQTETGANMRFFWSPDHRTWVIQGSDGSSVEYGTSLDGTATATDDDDDGNIFRWNIVKRYDAERIASGIPANPIVYVWRPMTPANGGTLGYLTDIYDTSPPGQSAPTLDSFAHHTHLVYANQEPELTASPIAPVWKALPTFLLQRVDVTSEDISGTSGRQQVRRYYLSYNNGTYDGVGDLQVSAPPVLSQVQLEGNGPGAGPNPNATANNFEANGQLPDPSQSTPGLKSHVTTTFGYSPAFNSSSPSVAKGTPMPSLSAAATTPLLFDINNDGLPDVLDTQASPAAVWVNSGTGFPASAQTLTLASSTLDLTNVNQLAPNSSARHGYSLGTSPSAVNYAMGAFQPDGRIDLLWRGVTQAQASTTNCIDPANPAGLNWYFCDSSVQYSILTPSPTSNGWTLTPTAGHTDFPLQTQLPMFSYQTIDNTSVIGSSGGATYCAPDGPLQIGTLSGQPAFVKGSGAGSGQPAYQTVVLGDEYPLGALDFDGDGLADSFNAMGYGYLETDELWNPFQSTNYCDHTWYQYAIRFSNRDYADFYYPFQSHSYSAEIPAPSPPSEPRPRTDVCIAGLQPFSSEWSINGLQSLPPGVDAGASPFPGGSDGTQVLISMNPMASETSPADLDGDGILDLVQFTPGGGMIWWPGHGDGVFGGCTGWGGIPPANGGTPEGATVPSPVQCPCGNAASINVTFSLPSTVTVVAVHDVTGDGHADVIAAVPGGFQVYQNLGFSNGTISFASSAYNVPANSLLGWSGNAAPTAFYFADMDGSGVDDVIVQEVPSGGTDATLLGYVDLFGGVRPGLLQTIAHGDKTTNGVFQTTITYETTPQLAKAAAAAGLGWSTQTPQSLHAVSSVTTTTTTGDTYVTNYTYSNPIFDAHDNQFLGFQKVRQTTPAPDVTNNPATKMNTDTTYFYATCGANGTFPAQPCAGFLDYRFASYRALPTLEEVFDSTPSKDGINEAVHLSTTHHSWASLWMYQGWNDGRSVWRTYEKQTDTFLYDTSPFNNVKSLQTITDTDLTTTGGFYLYGSAHHLRKTMALDSFGNVQTVTDAGDVGDTSSTLPDPVVVTTTTWFVPPNVDADNNWIWRPQTITVGASTTDANARSTTYAYDSYGNLTDVKRTLSGTTTSLNRSGSLGAPNPPVMSQNGTATILHLDYDTTNGTGNVVDMRAFPAATGGSSVARCTQFFYDTAYAQLRTSSSVNVGDCNSAQTITTTVKFDRVLEVPTGTVAANNATTTMGYDGLGRLISVAKPDPNPLHVSQTIAPTTYAYEDTTFGEIVHVQEPAGSVSVATAATASYPARDTYRYLDGLGRTIQVVTTADTANQWVVSGQVKRDGRGRVVTAYIPSVVSGSGGDQLYPLAPTALSTGTSYDAFSRVTQTSDIDGTVTSTRKYHALSVETRDAEQAAASGAHIAAYTLTKKDGHGRTSEVDAVGNGGTIATVWQYQPTGEVIQLTKSGTDNNGTVGYSRQMQYDSMGRLVLNLEPNTGTSVSSAWIYAYDDLGDLVAMTDARGCGENITYDGAGRKLSEDYSPCLAAPAQVAYSAAQSNGDGTEAFYVYEGQTRTAGGVSGNPLQTDELVDVYDRASHTHFARDARERITEEDKQLAFPSVASEVPDPSTQPIATRYVSTVYTTEMQYDDRDRIASQTTGTDISTLQSMNATWAGVYGPSMVVAGYSPRGFLQSVSSSYGPIVTGSSYEPDGRVDTIAYGDVANTTLNNTYLVDPRHRLSESKVVRTAAFPAATTTYEPPAPGTLTPTQQVLLADDQIITTGTTAGYDRVNNPATITDGRNAAEWRGTYMPVTRSYVYDDAYRVTNITHSFPGTSDSDAFQAPVATTTAAASPFPLAEPPNRPTSQTFTYDGLGNIIASTDDAQVFFDRSLGTVTKSTTAPNQLTAASLGTTGREGSLNAQYDAAGNLVQIQLLRTGTCTGSSGCKQLFQYNWDEVGRLSEARRWDFVGGLHCISSGTLHICYENPVPTNYTYPAVPTAAPNADIDYAYDASGARVLRASTPLPAAGDAATTTYSAEIFASLRFDHVQWDPTTSTYDTTADSEIPYIALGGVVFGRVVYNANLPNITGFQHVYLEITDTLGSTSIVIDKDTSELIERTTYLEYGAVETDYHPDRWQDFREDYKFTGKEDDVEIGLTYFGARYYSPQMGRFISPDPLAIHGIQGDMNPYAYARGRVTVATDADGLDPTVSGPDYVSASPDGATMIFLTADDVSAIDAMASPPLPGWLTSGPWAQGPAADTGEPETGTVEVWAGVGLEAPDASGGDNGGAFVDSLKNFGIGAMAFTYGALQGLAPGGVLASLAPLPEGAQTPLFQYWLGAGQITGGAVAALGGAGGAIGGAFAEGPSFGTSTVVVVASAAEVANGLAAVGVGFTNMQMAAAKRGGTGSSQGRGGSPPNDHHVFPQEFRSWFNGRGVDIDKYLVELPENVHLDQLHARNIDTSAGPMKFGPGGIWNENWRQFIGANPNATAGQIMDFGRTMCAGFGISGCP